MMSTGIYIIKNVVNKKVYVGSAKNLNRRKHEHLYRLRAGVHHNTHLQRSWNNYGELAFVFIVIKNVDINCLLIEEQTFIEKFNATDEKFGYNICKVANSALGRKLTDETKRKIGQKHKGKKLSNDHIEAMRKAFKGKKRDPDLMFRISQSRIGVKQNRKSRSMEQIENIKRINTELANRRWNKIRDKSLMNLKQEIKVN